MGKLFILCLLAAVPAAAQLTGADLDSLPGLDGAMAEAKAEPGMSAEPLQRPDAARTISEISTALRLSSKQEERIAGAIKKRASEFDRHMKEYEKNSLEEKKWRYKMNDSRRAMEKINRDLPDTVREYLDDEQRQEYDELTAARNKPAPAPEAALRAGEEGAPKVIKKKRRVKRKAPPAAEAAPGADDEAGQVMVDKDSMPPPPPPGKKRRLKRKAPPAQPAPQGGPAQRTDVPADAEPSGKDAPPEDAEAGSYP